MNMFLEYMDVQQQIFSNLLNADLQEDKLKVPVNWFNNFEFNANIPNSQKIPDTIENLIKEFSLYEDIIKTIFANLTPIKEGLFRKNIRHRQRISPKIR